MMDNPNPKPLRLRYTYTRKRKRTLTAVVCCTPSSTFSSLPVHSPSLSPPPTCFGLRQSANAKPTTPKSGAALPHPATNLGSVRPSVRGRGARVRRRTRSTATGVPIAPLEIRGRLVGAGRGARGGGGGGDGAALPDAPRGQRLQLQVLPRPPRPRRRHHLQELPFQARQGVSLQQGCQCYIWYKRGSHDDDRAAYRFRYLLCWLWVHCWMEIRGCT